MQGRLTHAEECILCGRAQAGDDDARNRLVVEHMGLARILARRGARTGRVDAADLMQEAVLGICHAALRFDPERHPGVRFGTYASIWMRQRIGRALADSGLIHVPEHAYKMAKSRRDGPDPVGSKRDQRDAAARILDAEFEPPHDAAARAEPPDDDEDLGEGLATLPMIQRHVVGRLYGLDGDEPASRNRVAEEIGCSAWAVERIARAALERLREELSRRNERRRRPCAWPKKQNPNRRKV